MAESSSQIDNMENVFAGGDCVTGPATAIRAIAAGKVAAANIDEQLGFHHEIRTDVEIPAPHLDVCPRAAASTPKSVRQPSANVILKTLNAA